MQLTFTLIQKERNIEKISLKANNNQSYIFTIKGKSGKIVAK